MGIDGLESQDPGCQLYWLFANCQLRGQATWSWSLMPAKYFAVNAPQSVQHMLDPHSLLFSFFVSAQHGMEERIIKSSQQPQKIGGKVR